MRDIKFERNFVSSDLPVSLCLFSEAAKSGAYGVVAYMKQGGTCHNVFAKAKIVPTIERSLPILELLGVFTAIKFLKMLLKTYLCIQINEIVLGVDAQMF